MLSTATRRRIAHSTFLAAPCPASRRPVNWPLPCRGRCGKCTNQIALSLPGTRSRSVFDEVAVQSGRTEPRRQVGHVDRRGTLVDHGLQHAAQGVHVVAGWSRVVPDVAHRSSAAHRLVFARSNTSRAHAQFLFHAAATWHEGVDTPARRALERLGRARDVAVVGAGAGISIESDTRWRSLHRLEVTEFELAGNRPRSRRPSAARAAYVRHLFRHAREALGRSRPWPY